MYKKVSGYQLRDDLFYDQNNNYWIEKDTADTVKIGIDELGLDISGTISSLSLPLPPQHVEKGEEMGALEAEKFVGPLIAPLSGTVIEVNSEVIDGVRSLYEAPYETWIVRMSLKDQGELDHLVAPSGSLESFKMRVERYRKAGILSW